MCHAGGAMSISQSRTPSIEERPRIRAIESPDDHRSKKFRRKVPQVYAMASAGLRLDGFPMGADAAYLATKVTQRAITPYVAFRIFRMTFNGDAAEPVVPPYTAGAAAQ